MRVAAGGEGRIPPLNPGRLGATIPSHTHPGFGYPITPRSLVIWSTPEKARSQRVPAGCVLAFYVDDKRFESLWNEPERSAGEIAAMGFAAVIEPDFSLWADDPLPVQRENTYRTRTLGRLWQRFNVPVIPSLNWSTRESFAFAFAGIPRAPRLAACECQTASHPESRPRFAEGLAAAVAAVAPQTILIYGGEEHAEWLAHALPHGPKYLLLPTWQTARRDMEGR